VFTQEKIISEDCRPGGSIQRIWRLHFSHPWAWNIPRDSFTFIAMKNSWTAESALKGKRVRCAKMGFEETASIRDSSGHPPLSMIYPNFALKKVRFWSINIRNESNEERQTRAFCTQKAALANHFTLTNTKLRRSSPGFRS
jgi:hypothetical protein